MESLHYTSINSIDITTVKKQLRTGVGIISSFSFTQSHGCHPYQEKKKRVHVCHGDGDWSPHKTKEKSAFEMKMEL